MITHPNEAIQAILKSLKPGKTEKISVAKASGFVLAQDVKAPLHSPVFDNSAMDGYAFRFNDWQKKNNLVIAGESSAGKPYPHRLKKNQAVRIYTGAAIPLGADTVVMQERIRETEKKLVILDSILKKGANIRKAGSEIRKGALALAKGTLLTPAACSFLASLGITEVMVYKKPSVAVIVTGNELVKAGTKLKAGQIYESNSSALRHALQKEGIRDINISYVRDNPSAMSKVFEKAVTAHDVVLFTGGISVGDYDFTEQVFAKGMVQKVFYKLKQKPGKPIFFGTSKGKAVFGLPGNPASVLTCFYVYVIPALRALQCHPVKELPRLTFPAAQDFKRKSGMTAFLKAFTDFRSIAILEGQESYIMRSFAKANALVILDPEIDQVVKHTPVLSILLP